MGHVYTLEIGGVARKFVDLNYETKLVNKSPTKITAKIEYAADIDYFDLIEIKSDGTTEWKGFLEDKDIDWSSGGRYLDIGGRDTSVIEWKKWCENFINMHPDTGGFFGSVSAMELIKFILRCPKSDPVNLYPHNKEGWGIDAGRIRCSALQTSVGDPNWTVLRRQGYGWRNVGNPYGTKVPVVDAVISNQWSTNGSTPYLDDNDDTNYIFSGTADQIAVFSFEDLSALDGTATGINKCYLTVVWKPDQSWWNIVAEAELYLSSDGGSTWALLGNFGGKTAMWEPNPWRVYTWDVSNIIDTIAKADAAQVKFVNKSSSLTMYITQAKLNISYSSGGSQALGDEFDIYFPRETVMGMYVESRQDAESYPRNYALLHLTEILQNINTYTEIDPNNHITKFATHIDFDAYQDEDAYVYKDFGVNYFDGYFDHRFMVGFGTNPIPANRLFGIWAVTNDIDDYIGLASGSRDNLAMMVFNGGIGPKFYLREVHDGVSNISGASLELDENDIYTILVKRIGASVKAYIYSGSGALFDTLSLTMVGTTNYFRYLFSVLTANDGNAYHVDVNIDLLSIQTYEDLGWVNNNVFKEILVSWSPKEMNHIRIRITDSANYGWAISQVYVYKAEELDYRVCYEGGTAPTFPLEQYIQTITFDNNYTSPIGPLNVPKARLLDAINRIVEMCNLAYISFDNWLALDEYNTFHMATAKGSDKSGSISFIKGTHLGGVRRSGSVGDTVQRLQIVGKGEGKKQDEVSSDWITDVAALVDINTFYEDVQTEKGIANKDMADCLANIRLKDNSLPNESIEVNVTNDEYVVGAYVVGDLVTITDSLTGTSGAKKIYNIRKWVDGDMGETIKLNVNAPRVIVEDEIKEIYRRLKELGIVGTLAIDWGGEALNESKVSAEAALSSLFEKTAKNDVVDAKKSVQDPTWYVNDFPASYTPQTGKSFTY